MGKVPLSGFTWLTADHSRASVHGMAPCAVLGGHGFLCARCPCTPGGGSRRLAGAEVCVGIWALSPLGPLGFEGAQHRQTLRPSVDGVRSKALRPFGVQ